MEDIKSRNIDYRKILDSVDEALIILDSRLHVLYFNGTAEKLTNHKAADCLGKHIVDDIFPTGRGGVIEDNYCQALKDRKPRHFEAFVGTPQYRGWYSFRVEPVDDILVVYFQNTTVRKNTEEALRQSQDLFRRIVETANEGILSDDVDQVTTFVNRRMAEMLGYAPSEMMGRKYIDFLFGEDVADQSARFMVRRRGEAQDYRIKLRHKDGHTVWCAVSASPLMDGEQYVGSFGMFTDITEMIRTTEALQASENRFRSLFDSAADAIFIHDYEGRFLEVNEAACRRLGYSREELLEMGPRDIDSPKYSVMVQSRIEELKRHGRIMFETAHVARDGKEFAIELNSRIINYRGQPAILSVARDITERRKAEEALRESERRLATLMGNLPGMAYRSLNHPDWPMEFVSEGCAELTGYMPEELMIGGKINFGALIYPEDREYVWDTVQKGIAQNRRFKLQYRILTRDGSMKWVWEQGRGILNSQGGLEALEGFIADISDRIRAEEALHQSRQAYQNLTENSSDIISRYDREYRCHYINPAIVTVTGKEAGFYVNKTIKEFGMPEDFTLYWCSHLDSVFISQKPFHGEMEFAGIRGKAVFDLWMIPEFDTEGKVVTVLTTARDVTETRRLQELESRARRLETAGQIAGQVAHDFNNMLAPLMAYPDFIRAELPPGNAAVKFVDDIERAARQMAEINQQLLTLGRRGHYVQEPLNLNFIISEIIEELSAAAPELKILPKLDESLLNIKGGRAQLYRALFNLANNARDAMHDKGTISLKTENYYVEPSSLKYNPIPQGEYVKVTITDTGCGIPPEHMSRIFDPFFTLKTTDKKRGSGLGLSVVDAVVKDHRGFIDIESEVGRGTSFYIYFPITREIPTPVAEFSIVGGTESILVVDDDPVQREVTKTLLERLGYRVTTVASGERAAGVFKSSAFDLMILDMIMLPGIDGVETLRRVRQICPTQKSLLVSGFSESQRVNEALKMGAGGYIRKPLDLKVIAAAVRRELDRKTAESIRPVGQI